MEWLTTSTVLGKLQDFDDRSAWGLLAEHFRQPVVRFAIRLGLEPADAQDAAQETLLAFAQAYREGRYDRSKGRLKSWLFGIAHRQIANMRRKVRGRRPINQADMGGSAALEHMAVEERSQASWWEEEWQRAVYEQCLRRVQTEVTAETFEVFRMFVTGGRSAGEVAEQLGISRTKVYNAKFRVAQRLAELAKQYEDA